MQFRICWLVIATITGDISMHRLKSKGLLNHFRQTHPQFLSFSTKFAINVFQNDNWRVRQAPKRSKRRWSGLFSYLITKRRGASSCNRCNKYWTNRIIISRQQLFPAKSKRLWILQGHVDLNVIFGDLFNKFEDCNESCLWNWTVLLANRIYPLLKLIIIIYLTKSYTAIYQWQ